ncbi:MAG: s-methyl-5-thioribose-1-phosphate isomerase [Burkholderiaceae bacterium]
MPKAQHSSRASPAHALTTRSGSVITFIDRLASMSIPEAPLPTLLRDSVILEPDRVRILDRRVFPFEKSFVECRTYEEVARAIEHMVTQSNGPFFASSAALVLAARALNGESDAGARREKMALAGARLIATRATNNNIATAVGRILQESSMLTERGPDFSTAVEAQVRRLWDERRAISRHIGAHAATLLHDGDHVLTHCWADAAFIETLVAAGRSGKRLEVTCTETRPYLQGARLTAHSVAELGLPVTVITDGMAAWAMDRGRVNVFITAADRVTMSGHVVNKIGTLQLAIAANAYKLPYFVTVSQPDPNALTPADVPIEERDARESLFCLGNRTATPLARGWYPSFDITPPSLVSAIVCRQGIFPATTLQASLAASQ